MVRTARCPQWRLLLLAVAAFSLAGIACRDGKSDTDPDVAPGAAFETVTIEAGQPIKIGISTVLSGDRLSIGEPLAQAVELAGRDIDIEGFSLQFVRRDDLCSNAGGASAAIQLIEAGVVAVVGPSCSAAVLAAQPHYEQAGITHVSPSSTAISATAPPGHAPFPTFFRVTYNDSIQAPAQAAFARDVLNAGTAYLVHDSDPYGSGLASAFRSAFEAAGGEVTGQQQGYEAGETNFSGIVADIQLAHPDLVYFAGFYPEAAPFVQQLRATDPDVLFLSADGVRDDAFLVDAGEAAEGAYLSVPSPRLEGDVFDDFAERFEATYNQPAVDTPYTAEAFDASTIIVNAIEAVATLEGDALSIDLGALNAAIRDTSYDGAIGHIEFDEKGDNAGGEIPVTFFKVENGAFIPVE